jgi:putative acetyltransferase
MRIRKFTKGDEPVLWDLFYNTIHRRNINDYTQEQLDAWAPANLDPALWQNKIQTIKPFVVEHNGEIVGYADLQDDGFIDHFYCHHAWQRQGIGRMLMKKIYEEAKVRDVLQLYSNVSVTAKPFFVAQGFEVVKEHLISIRGQELLRFRMQKYLQRR